MFIIKMNLKTEDKKSVEWDLQGLDKRPLRFTEYRHAEREAELQRNKHSDVEGFSCLVIEEL